MHKESSGQVQEVEGLGKQCQAPATILEEIQKIAGAKREVSKQRPWKLGQIPETLEKRCSGTARKLIQRGANPSHVLYAGETQYLLPKKD